jgi:hypothetical protein
MKILRHAETYRQLQGRRNADKDRSIWWLHRSTLGPSFRLMTAVEAVRREPSKGTEKSYLLHPFHYVRLERVDFAMLAQHVRRLELEIVLTSRWRLLS